MFKVKHLFKVFKVEKRCGPNRDMGSAAPAHGKWQTENTIGKEYVYGKLGCAGMEQILNCTMYTLSIGMFDRSAHGVQMNVHREQKQLLIFNYMWLNNQQVDLAAGKVPW